MNQNDASKKNNNAEHIALDRRCGAVGHSADALLVPQTVAWYANHGVRHHQQQTDAKRVGQWLGNFTASGTVALQSSGRVQQWLKHDF